MATKEQLQDRRRTVWELYLRGVPLTVISRTLNVHRNTINNDLRELRKTHKQQVSNVDISEEVGDLAAKYDEIFKYAISEYATTDREGAKSSFLSQAQEALHKKSKLLMDVGIIPKAAQEVSGRIVIEGVDVQKADLRELKSIRDKLLARMGHSIGTN